MINFFIVITYYMIKPEYYFMYDYFLFFFIISLNMIDGQTLST